MLLCQTLYSEVGSESDICVRNHTVCGNTDLGTQILIWWHTCNPSTQETEAGGLTV